MTSPSDAETAWREWRERREAALRAPDGWPALSGLHWLSEGENRLDGVPGTFVQRDGHVTLRAAREDGWLLDGEPATERLLSTDAAGKPDRLVLSGRTAQVIERGGAFALRVWDAANPARRAFKGIEAYPYAPGWRLEARWEPYPEPREVLQPSAAGPPQRARAPGRAHFTIDPHALSLEPTLEDGALLFVFRDATAPAETYGGGRFLRAPPPAAGKAILDFNRAFNPPCAFTPYATCPLPERHDWLPIRVEAGEKKPAEHG